MRRSPRFFALSDGPRRAATVASRRRSLGSSRAGREQRERSPASGNLPFAALRSATTATPEHLCSARSCFYPPPAPTLPPRGRSLPPPPPTNPGRIAGDPGGRWGRGRGRERLMQSGTAGDKGRAAAGRAAALCGELPGGGRGRRSSRRGPRGGAGRPTEPRSAPLLRPRCETRCDPVDAGDVFLDLNFLGVIPSRYGARNASRPRKAERGAPPVPFCCPLASKARRSPGTRSGAGRERGLRPPRGLRTPPFVASPLLVKAMNEAPNASQVRRAPEPAAVICEAPRAAAGVCRHPSGMGGEGGRPSAWLLLPF